MGKRTAAQKESISYMLSSDLNPNYTFDQFAIGTSNQFAYSVAKAVANNSLGNGNPLFIYAGTGLGKTHLLNAIGHVYRNTLPQKKVCYCSVEKFMCGMVNHLRNKDMESFRNYFRSLDVFLIDDIQFMSGKSGTQEEFFHTINSLYEARKPIVLTSGEIPWRISDLDEHLRSRFAGMLFTEILPPDLETKFAIIKTKSEAAKRQIPDDVLQFIASSDTHDIRELEGMLVKLIAHSVLQDTPITLKMAITCLSRNYWR